MLSSHFFPKTLHLQRKNYYKSRVPSPDFSFFQRSYDNSHNTTTDKKVRHHSTQISGGRKTHIDNKNNMVHIDFNEKKKSPKKVSHKLGKKNRTLEVKGFQKHPLYNANNRLVTPHTFEILQQNRRNSLKVRKLEDCQPNKTSYNPKQNIRVIKKISRDNETFRGWEMPNQQFNDFLI